MSAKTSKVDPSGLRAANEITQDRIASVVDVKIGVSIYSSVAKETASRNSSGQFVIRNVGRDGETRVVQKK